MDLSTRINNDIKVAMLAKEKEKLNALRAIKSALLLEATKDGSGVIEEEAGLKILQKQYKQRMESIALFVDQGRTDLIAEEQLQADVIAQYLPKPLSAEELREEIQKLILAVGASSMADLGKVMGAASKALSGKADGKLIADTVKSLLSA